MKKILITLLLALITINVNCGGGGGTSGSAGGTSLVTINVGNSSNGKAMALLNKEPSPYIGIASIPSNVYKIVFTIAAPDMSPITKEVLVAGQETITETFSVPNGNDRHFHVEAENASGLVLYQGDITATLVGEPVILMIYMTALDTTAPTVISTIPPNGATEVSVTLAILITFSETIDPATFNSSTFTLRDNGSTVAGSIDVNGAVASFTPSSDLAYDTTYTGTITTGVTDLAGNPMAANYIWSFTTGIAPDTTPPTVTGVSPGIGAIDVPVASTLTATFSEAMDESTINTSTFTLVDGDSNPVSGTVTYAGTTATFTPSSNLAPGITYTATVTTGVRDLAGNAMADNYTWSFTTIIEDTTPPTFGGVESATAISTTQIQLQWSAATDNVTPSSNITYLIYMATTSGGQNYASPSYSAIGVTTTTISGLAPCTTYYFVVRARDAALNTETNTVERSATTLCLGWAKSYGGMSNDMGFSIQQTSDGGYIVTGFTISFGAGGSDFWVSKLNSDGTIAWQKTYGGAGGDVAQSIQQTSDGGYIVAGSTSSFGAGSNDFWVLKLNILGVIQWQRAYGGAGADVAQSIRQTSDGGYIVTGFTNSFGAGGSDMWVLKLNSDLTVNWQGTYGSTGAETALSIQQTSDGGYIVAGSTSSFGAGSNDFWILKLTSAGAIQWEKTYGGVFNESAFSVQQTTPDGGYIVAGYTTSFGAGNDDFWVLKLNSSGVIQWQNAYGGANADGVYSIRQTSDGGYIVAGYTSSFGIVNDDFWVLKLNSTGAIQWQKAYGGSSLGEIAQSIQQTSDGGYIVTGDTNFGAGGSDFWVLKLLNDGTLGCGFGVDTTATVTNTVVTDANTTAAVNVPVYTLTNTVVTDQNTSATVNTQCSGGGFVDLQPTSASIVVLPGVSYTVTNYGTTAVNNVTVWVEYGDACSTVCSPRTISVPASGTFSETVPTSPITPTIYTIVVDPNNTVSESVEWNNCLDSGAGGCSFPPVSCP